MDLYLHRRRLRLLLLVLGLGLGASLCAQPFPRIIWQRDGAGDSSRYGEYLYALGDQNDDGYADFAVDAAGWGPPGQASEAITEFFYGGNPPSAAPYRIFRGDSASGRRCFGMVVLGDINGDHMPDWGVLMDTTLYQTYVLRVYYGSSDPNSAPDYTFVLSYDANIWGMGDFNGDGFDDMYRYDWAHDFGQVLYGSTAMDTLPAWTRHSPPEFEQQALPISYGDLNGDGYDDWIGASYHVFWGGAQPDTVPGMRSPCDLMIGDLSGDGRADLACGLEVRWGGNTISQQPNVLLTSPCQGPVGGTESGVGDINGDGWADLLLSAEYCGNDYFGAAMLYLGSPWMTSAPAYTFWGGDPPAGIIGHRVAAGLGDVNGDGMNDFALGGFNDTNIGFRGRTVIVAGDAGLHAAVDEPVILQPSSQSLAVYPNPFNAVATISFAVPHTGGVSVTMFDLTGRLVKTLCEGRREAGEQAVVFEGKGLSSGVYVVRVQAGAESRAVKVMLLK